MFSILQKRCRACGVDKPLSAFYKNRNSPDRHASECKDCAKARALAWSKANADRNRQRAREWYANNSQRVIDNVIANRKRKRAERGDVPEPTVAEKRCQHCKRVQPADSFWLHKGQPDGLYPVCKACSKAGHLSWRERNREWLREYSRIAYYRNVDRRRTLAAIRRRINRDAINARHRVLMSRPEQKARHKERVRQYQARKKTAWVERVSFDAIWERDKGVCYLCGLPVERSDCHFDHVIPLARGGSHTMDNVKVTHSTCNLQKGNRLPEEVNS